MRLGEHAGGLVLVEEIKAYEEPEHGAAERFRQPRRVVHRRRHQRPVGPEPAVGDEEVEVRMPVGPRAVRLHAGHDADRVVALARQRADGRGDGAGGDAGDLAEQASRYRQYARSRLGMVSATCRCGTGARSVVSCHCAQISSRLA